jgi:thioesterase domain-containing protein
MNNSALAALEQRWHEEIPLSAAMGLRVLPSADNTLRLSAPLAPNRNVHGTAFAGSLYAAAALCGWGRMALTLEAAGLDGELVIAEGTIRYRRPVTEALALQTTFPEAEAEAFCAALRARGKARQTLEVSLNGEGEDVCARFEGVYAVRLITP